ncbi:MAG: lanthionine synthetase C family protein [Gaiellaceae bacterium]
MIYRKAEHEALAGRAWDERLVRYAIADIVDDAIAAGPLEEEGIYAGNAGAHYALRALGRDVDWPIGAGDGPGYADGELGIAIVTGDVARFRVAAGACIANEWIELLYGAGGALVGARLLGLDDVARDAIQRLWSTWSFDSELRACIWTQRNINGRVGQTIGMAHGVAGNVFALLKAAPLQSREHQTELVHRAVETFERTALRQRKLVNWPPEPGDPTSKLRVQWCHGAPGIVCALAGAPAHRELDALLLAAGELTWEAGPLRKGGGLCHGTAGNGWAFLKLHKRTRDRKWLERARRFAMHAIEQRTSELPGLLAGDLGVALYAQACIEVDDRWPLLDVR